MVFLEEKMSLFIRTNKKVDDIGLQDQLKTYLISPDLFEADTEFVLCDEEAKHFAGYMMENVNMPPQFFNFVQQMDKMEMKDE